MAALITSTAQSVQLLSLAYFGRPADPASLISHPATKVRDEEIVEAFIKTSEFSVNTITANSSANPGGGVTYNETNLINTYYQRLFGRLAVAEEVAGWKTALATGRVNHDYLGITIGRAGLNLRDSVPAEKAMKDVLLAKISTADAYSAVLAADASSLNSYNSSAAAAKSGADFLLTVTTTVAATAAQVSAAVAEMVSGKGAVGQTFTLTASTDIADSIFSSRGTIDTTSSFTFSAGNEAIKSGAGTLGANDTLIDDSTTDTDVLTANLIANSGTFTAANVETINATFAAGSPVLDLANVTGTTAINVSGNVAGTIDDLNAQTQTPLISIDGYAKELTVTSLTNAGTTAASTAETLNFKVANTTAGKSKITLTSDANGTLETLNIESAGTAANAFTLDANTNTALKKVALTGAADVTVSVSAADVTAKTIDATGATSTSQALEIDHAGRTTTATAASKFSGLDNIIIKDSTAPAVGGDSASLSGLLSGQKITLADDFNSSAYTLAAPSGTADSLTVVLDNETAATDTDVARIDVQNIESLNITSSGYSTSSSTSAENKIDNLTGDSTTITIDGDTSLDLDLNIDAPSTGSRTVTVNASANTAFVDIEAAAQAKVSYTITGTAGKDTLALSASGGTINGEGGNDTLTGGTGVDIYSGGAGDDHIDATMNADTITTGDGKDTIDVDSVGAGAVAQVTSVDVEAVSGAVVVVGDTLTAIIDGQAYTSVANATTHDTGMIDVFIAEHKSSINLIHGITVAAVDADAADGFKFTGKADGTAFTIDTYHGDAGVLDQLTEVATAVGVKEEIDDLQTSIVDFSSTDIIDTTGLTALGAGGYFEGAVADLTAGTAYGAVVLTGASYATQLAAEDAVTAVSTSTTDAVVVYHNSTTGKAAAYFDADIAVDGSLTAVAQMFEFDNINSLTELAATFSSSSFNI
jgi:hypothetical protein